MWWRWCWGVGSSVVTRGPRDGVQEEDGRLYVLFERAQGQTLLDMVEETGCGIEEAVVQARVAAPLVQLLALLHSAGLIHRDLMPGNLVLSKVGELKVIDFNYMMCFLLERPLWRAGHVHYIGEFVCVCVCGCVVVVVVGGWWLVAGGWWLVAVGTGANWHWFV